MNSSVQQPNIIKTASRLDFPRIILLVSILLIGLILGFLTNRSLSPKASLLQDQSSKDTLPIESTILQNPVVGAWRGEVAGKLTAKTDTSITISNDQGQSITIPIDPGAQGTKFINQSSITKGELNAMISLKDIPIGSKLRGDFFFLGKDRILGSSFIVEQ